MLKSINFIFFLLFSLTFYILKKQQSNNVNLKKENLHVFDCCRGFGSDIKIDVFCIWDFKQLVFYFFN